jgi:hypothetical protein
MAERWSGTEHARCVELVTAGRTYAQVARTLNAEFHTRRCVRTEKAVELHCREHQCQARTLRAYPTKQAAPATPRVARVARASEGV